MRRSVGLLRIAFAGVISAFVLPSGIGAQSLEESELQYREALTFYDAVSANRDVVANRFYSLLDSLTRARDSEDQNRVDALEGRSRDVGVELSRLDIRLEDAEEAYETAREALLASLGQRLDSLGTLAEMSADPVRRESIGRMIFDLQLQYAQVAAEELEETIGPPSMMVPAFRVDPRDTPATLRAKAEFLQGKVADFEREIGRVDELLEGYQRELRLERFTGDARASIDRFGDTQVPVRGSGGVARTDQGIAADTLGVALESLAPEDAIARLQGWRASLVLLRDGTLAALQNIRNEIRGTPQSEHVR
jgi:tetratricopeptide (TPR) repeat protein